MARQAAPSLPFPAPSLLCPSPSLLSCLSEDSQGFPRISKNFQTFPNLRKFFGGLEKSGNSWKFLEILGNVRKSSLRQNKRDGEGSRMGGAGKGRKGAACLAARPTLHFSSLPIPPFLFLPTSPQLEWEVGIGKNGKDWRGGR